MTDEEIKNAVLKRLYSGAFEPNVDYELNLGHFAKELNISHEKIWKMHDDLLEEDLLKFFAGGGWIAPTTSGLLHCEHNNLVSDDQIIRQNKIRITLLNTLASIYEQHGREYYFDWQDWCREAGIDEQDFNNNIKILEDLWLVEITTSKVWAITQDGRDKVKKYCELKTRLESFEKLEELNGINPQQRGHKLENLLAEVTASEGWETEKRVRSQGQEHDIIINTESDYYFVSCKWEQKPIQSKEIDVLISRVQSRASTKGGIIFSMSGFTKNCIEETRKKINIAQILLFGSNDIKKIFENEITFTDLLMNKLKKVMRYRKILIDNEAK